MKKALTLNLSLCLLAICLFAANSIAQSCESYFPLVENCSFQMSSYNAKDKLESVVNTKIKGLTATESSLTAEVEAVIQDGKGKETSRVDYGVVCDNGELKIDMKSMLNGAQMQGAKDMELTFESEDLIFPSALNVGTSLPDASIHMKGSMNGMSILNMNIRIFNRKVVAEESMTTPAGTFKCIVVEEESEMTSMGMKFVSSNKSWYSLGVGTVRSESSRKGKLDSYSVLTEFKR